MQLSQEFQQNICVYNSALAFTYIGAKIDDHITGTRGPYTFHIHIIELGHQLLNLLHLHKSIFLILINETQNRLNIMPSLNQVILAALQNINMLYDINPYVILILICTSFSTNR